MKLKVILVVLVLYALLLWSLPLWPAEFLTSGSVVTGITLCPAYEVDYCVKSNTMGTIGVEVTLAEVLDGDLSFVGRAVHYSDITDNNWSSPRKWLNTGDRGTEFFGIEARYRLW